MDKPKSNNYLPPRFWSILRPALAALSRMQFSGKIIIYDKEGNCYRHKWGQK